MDSLPSFCYSFKCQPHKIVEYTQTNRRLLPMNFFSVFDHFVWLVKDSFAAPALNISLIDLSTNSQFVKAEQLLLNSLFKGLYLD